MPSNLIPKLSEPCVPVSITETQLSNFETNSTEYGHENDGLDVYELAEHINCLIEAGYSLGCDGELLPPKWAYNATRGTRA
jgi:hypothetical protein